MSQKVDPKLLEILVCPLTKAPLRYDEARAELISDKARLAYPIRDGIPIMLIDEARQLDDAPPEPEVGEPGAREPGVGGATPDSTGDETGERSGDGAAGR